MLKKKKKKEAFSKKEKASKQKTVLCGCIEWRRVLREGEKVYFKKDLLQIQSLATALVLLLELMKRGMSVLRVDYFVLGSCQSTYNSLACCTGLPGCYEARSHQRHSNQ